MALKVRDLIVVIKIGKGSFGLDGFNTVTLRGLRVAAKVKYFGGSGNSQLDLTIWGLALAKINQLDTLGIVDAKIRNNRVLVQATDESGQYATVFQGEITQSWADFTAAPDVALRLTASENIFIALQPAPPTSYKEDVPVATLLEQIAVKMGVAFQNHGVTTVIAGGCYFWRSLREQAIAIVEAAGIQWNSVENGVLAIWPNDGYRRTGSIIEISAKTGMVGYPTHYASGVMVRTLFNPRIKQGVLVKVISDLKPANKVWRVNSVELDLAARQPGGPWFTTITASTLGNGTFDIEKTPAQALADGTTPV